MTAVGRTVAGDELVDGGAPGQRAHLAAGVHSVHMRAAGGVPEPVDAASAAWISFLAQNVLQQPCMESWETCRMPAVPPRLHASNNCMKWSLLSLQRDLRNNQLSESLAEPRPGT